MKKMVQLLGVALLLMATWSQPTYAGVFETAGIINPGHFSLGLEPAFYFEPSTFVFYIHGGMGLTRSIDLDLTLGLSDDIYFGADVEFALVPDNRRGPGVSVSMGAHGTNNLGLDATLLVSNSFRTFNLYGALDVDMEFVRGADDDDETETFFPVYIVIGVAIPVSHNMEFLLEGDIGVTSASNSSLCGGISFYF